MRVDGCSWGDVEFVSKFIGRVDREGRWSTHSSSAKVGEARSETGTAIASLSYCPVVWPCLCRTIRIRVSFPFHSSSNGSQCSDRGNTSAYLAIFPELEVHPMAFHEAAEGCANQVQGFVWLPLGGQIKAQPPRYCASYHLFNCPWMRNNDYRKIMLFSIQRAAQVTAVIIDYRWGPISCFIHRPPTVGGKRHPLLFRHKSHDPPTQSLHRPPTSFKRVAHQRPRNTIGKALHCRKAMAIL